ncbi:hypothetical protein H7Y63_03255 [Polaromonas sp.]|nr:hypothetical protein [Candidatus Saccharibacteria bacterium]
MKWFAEFSRHHLVTTSVILIFEILFYRQYAHLGAEFHFWLHGLFGASIGLCALTIWQLCTKRGSRLSGWEAGALGHLYSAIPDIIFVATGVLHMYWMDILALHISIHFIPSPIATMLAIFLLCLLSYVLVQGKYRWIGCIVLGLAGVILAVALWHRQPIPTTLQQVKHQTVKYSWLCPMWDTDSH